MPLVIAKCAVPTRGIIMTLVIAQLGALPLAGSALGFTLYMSAISFLMGVLLPSVGVSIAYAIGANAHDKVRDIIQHGWLLGFLLSVPLALLFYYSEPLLLLLGQQKIIAHQAQQFLRGLAWSFFPAVVLVANYKLFINVNKAHIPMLYVLSGLLLTAVNIYALGLGKFGLPHLGIFGVGLALSISSWLSAFIVSIHISFAESTKGYQVFSRFLSFDIKRITDLWRIGWPVGLRNNAESMLYFVIASIVGIYSHNDLPVLQVLLQFFALTTSLSAGVGYGAEALIAQILGAKRFHDVRIASYASIVFALLLTSIVVFILLLFPHWVAHFFFPLGSHPFVLLVSMFGIVAVFQLIDACREMLSDILVTFKDSRFPLFSGILSFWLIGLPIGFSYGLYSEHVGIRSLFIGLLIGLVVNFLLLLKRFKTRVLVYEAVD